MSYEFQNADICPQAREAFGDWPTHVHDAVKYAHAARHVDQAMGILKRGYAAGTLGEHDYDDVLNHIEEAEEILEDLGVLEDHEYLREDIEPRAAELVSVDAIDVNDDAAEYDSTDDWLFGGDGEGSEDSDA